MATGSEFSTMFCPSCGNAGQQPESYCRRCGTFLPDLSKPVKRGATPQQHVTANIVLSSMTIVAAVALAILIYLMLAFRPDTHPLIYVTAGVLLAIACWHTQSLWRTFQLKRHLKEISRVETAQMSAPVTGPLLDEADMSNAVPASVAEHTTRTLEPSRLRSPQA